MNRLYALPVNETAQRRAQREKFARMVLNADGGKVLIYTDGGTPRGGREIPERDFHSLPPQDLLWLLACKAAEDAHAQAGDGTAFGPLEDALRAERDKLGGGQEDGK